METDRASSYVSEVSRLSEQVTSRDRAVLDLNNEIESLRRDFNRLNESHQQLQQQLQLAQHAAYDLLT